jgi:hypothetical protein
VESGVLKPEEIKTEMFLLPAALPGEKEGTFTNTHRLVQWHDKVVEPPGDCRSDLWFMFHLGRRLKALYAGSIDPKDAPIQQVTWQYPTIGPNQDPSAEAVLKEINGYTWPDRKQPSSPKEIQEDGSTACGCWIYCGTYPKPIPLFGYALFRQDGETPAWHAINGSAGCLTVFAGAYLAVIQSDMKRMLAYTTICALGMFFMALGIGRPEAITAAVVYLAAHAFYKCGLFMTAGILDHQTGTRRADRLGGLARLLPFTAAAGGLLFLSGSGLPPALGYIGKEIFYRSLLEGFKSPTDYLFAGGIFLAAIVFTIAAGVVGIKPFFGPKIHPGKAPQEAAASLWSIPMLLGISGIAIGLFPGLIENRFVSPAAFSVLRRHAEPDLSLWHGLNLPAIIGFSALVLGGMFLLRWEKIRNAASRMDLLPRPQALRPHSCCLPLRSGSWSLRFLSGPRPSSSFCS